MQGCRDFEEEHSHFQVRTQIVRRKKKQYTLIYFLQKNHNSLNKFRATEEREKKGKKKLIVIPENIPTWP